MRSFGIFMHLLYPPPMLIINLLAILDIQHSYATFCLCTKIFQGNLASRENFLPNSLNKQRGCPTKDNLVFPFTRLGLTTESHYAR